VYILHAREPIRKIYGRSKFISPAYELCNAEYLDPLNETGLISIILTH